MSRYLYCIILNWKFYIAAAALLWFYSACNDPPLPLAAGLLARLHTDDPVPAGGLLHHGGFHPDDGVGQGEAPQLPEGVPRLPSSPLTHPALHPVEDHLFTPSPVQYPLLVGVKYNPTPPPPALN